MIPLVWNGMMSFGGAWFFLVASESISVLGHTYALPGVGSYVAAALADGNLGEVGVAIVVMAVLVVGVNVVFWRPLVAWSQRFRLEQSTAVEQQRSLVFDVLRRSAVPHLVARPLRPVGRALDAATRPFGLAEHPLHRPVVRQRVGDCSISRLYLMQVLRLASASSCRRGTHVAVRWCSIRPRCPHREARALLQCGDGLHRLDPRCTWRRP